MAIDESDYLSSDTGRETCRGGAFLAARQPGRRANARRLVRPSFLEFARPSIEEGLAGLVAQGVGEVVVAPLLLFAADHVRRDIPAAVSKAAARHPGLRVRQVGHLGCHPRVVELSKRRFDEALIGRTAVSPRESLLLLVGRGSRDRRATEEMLRFADLRRQATEVGAWKHVYGDGTSFAGGNAS